MSTEARKAEHSIEVYTDDTFSGWGWQCLLPSCHAEGTGYPDEEAAARPAAAHLAESSGMVRAPESEAKIGDVRTEIDHQIRGRAVELALTAEMREPWNRDLMIGCLNDSRGGSLTEWADHMAWSYSRSGSLEVTALALALKAALIAASESKNSMADRLVEAWAEGFEAGWYHVEHQHTNGIPHDPPINPYEATP